MAELSARNFGLVIAYLIPGFVALWGVGAVCEPVRHWLLGGEAAGPSLGGVAYVVAASLTLGLTASAVRWAFIDQLHHRTGVTPPRLDFAKLADRLEGFYALVENHYRYYQFYANMAVATAFAFGLSLWGGMRLPVWAEVSVLGVEAIFLAGSRDALRKYYERSSLLLGEAEREVFNDERVPCRGGSGRDEVQEAGEKEHRAGKDPGDNQAQAGQEGADNQGMKGKAEEPKE